MVEIYAKNWAGFEISLQKQFEEVENQKTKTQEPYKQWELQEKMNLINEVMSAYVVYLNQIGDDDGITFLQNLRTKAQEMIITNNQILDKKTQAVYAQKYVLAANLYKEFKTFRLTK